MEYILISILTIVVFTFIVSIVANKILATPIHMKSLILCATCAILISLILPRMFIGIAGLGGTLGILIVFAMVSSYFIAYYYDNGIRKAAIKEDVATDFIEFSFAEKLKEDFQINENNDTITGSVETKTSNSIKSDNGSDNLPNIEDAQEFIPETIIEDVQELIPETVIEDVQELIPETVIEDVQELIPETVIEDTQESIPETIIEDVQELIPETVIEDVQELISETVIEDAQELIPETIIEDAQELIPEIVIEDAQELIPETVIEDVQELIPETVIEDVQELIPETVIEDVQELIPETVIEDVQESIPETVIEDVQELISESDIEDAQELIPETIIEDAQELIPETIIEDAQELIPETVIEDVQELIPETVIEDFQELIPETIIDDVAAAISHTDIEDVAASIPETVTEDIETLINETITEESATLIPETIVEENHPVSTDIDDLMDFAFELKEQRNFTQALTIFRQALLLYPSSEVAPFLVVEIGTILKNLGSYNEAIQVFMDGRSLPGIANNIIFEQEFINNIAYLRIVKNILVENSLEFMPFNLIPESAIKQIDTEFTEWRNQS